MIYLNNAATSYPKPPSVISAVERHIAAPPITPGRGGVDISGADVVESCRSALAGLFNLDNPADIILTSGATESLNLGIGGLDLAGSHVITTNTEHNSVLRPLFHLERAGSIELTVVQCDERGGIDPSRIAEAITAETTLLVIGHCSNVTGTVVDLPEIARLARRHNLLLLVDGSQSAGAIPIDLQRTPVDMFAFTGHKSLFGLPGTGGLYIRDGVDLKPLMVGGTGVRSDLLFQPEERPLRYEAGTPNLPGLAALTAGVEYILERGVEEIAHRKRLLCNRMVTRLRELADLVILGDPEMATNAGIVTFNIKGIDPADAGYMLESGFEITVRSGLHCAPLIHSALGSAPTGSIRVSPSCFNTEVEIDRFILAMEQISSCVVRR